MDTDGHGFRTNRPATDVTDYTDSILGIVVIRTIREIRSWFWRIGWNRARRTWPDFPRHGKKQDLFSTLWKMVFHAVEKSGPDFPRHGKILPGFSTPWKNGLSRFSGIFHAMEKDADAG